MRRTPHGPRVATVFLAAAVAVGGAAGCSEDQTALLVEVSSPDLSIPADVDALRFDAETESGKVAAQTFPVAETWPHSLAILPSGGETSARVTLRVVGLKGGEEVIRRVQRTAFVSGQTRQIAVVLTRACYEVSCPMDVDCVDGDCVGAPTDGGVDGGPTDGGGLDAGMDAGADGGPGDGGPSDGGPPDAPPADACTPTGAEICDGVDQDCDGQADEGLPCVGAIVLSEVATGGPTGASDEFVELYNTTGEIVTIGGLELEYRSASGASFSRRATIPAGATIPAHGYYLLAPPEYSRATTPDLTEDWTGFAAGGGHLRVVDGATVLDKLGWGGAVDPETAAFPALSDDTTQTYERKALSTSSAVTMQPGGADENAGNGFDSDDNSADFVARTPAGPQNTASAAEAP